VEWGFSPTIESPFLKPCGLTVWLVVEQRAGGVALFQRRHLAQIAAIARVLRHPRPVGSDDGANKKYSAAFVTKATSRCCAYDGNWLQNDRSQMASKRRKLVARFFNRIKQCRCVATRYDKLAANYLAFVKLVYPSAVAPL
jgi:hypothetical protein